MQKWKPRSGLGMWRDAEAEQATDWVSPDALNGAA